MIKRTHLSAMQPMPDEATMSLHVENALRLWREIPISEWGMATEEAIVEAGSYIATVGLVAKVWREGKWRMRKEIEAQRAIREANTTRYLGLPSPENRMPTQEEREANAESFRGIAESLSARSRNNTPPPQPERQ